MKRDARVRFSRALAVMAALSALGLAASSGSAADLGSSICSNAKDAQNPAFCHAVRGDRAEGWMAQGRSEVMARNGMVTTSQPLAAEAGLEILRRGGNAVDAAVSIAAVLNLVEPMNVGLAGDMFAIIYSAKDHKLHVLNASGMAASGQTLAFMNAHGYKFDPRNIGPGSGMARGVLSVTVPGAAWGWGEVLDKYGTMKFKQVLEPAAQYAEKGFPVSERIAFDWHLPKAVNTNHAQLENCCSEMDPDSIAAWYIDGKQPVAGQIYKNPDLAKTFRILEEKGRDGFYKGPVAEALVKKVRALGGTMTMDDLASYKGEWQEPVMTDYHGYTLAELPPPSQGFAANEMLNILATCTSKVYPGQTLASLGPTDARYWHLLIEAKTLAYADLNRVNGDPNANSGLKAQVQALTSAAHAQELCAKISPDKAMPALGPTVPTGGDTIVLSTADRWGNMVSWVNSNYANFGSGITVPGYGFILHNRGALFTLDPNSPNVIAPHKRPYNTLAAAFLIQGGRTDGQIMALQLMGGDMQSQGHAQVVVDMVDLGANLQAASDMARFHHNQVTDTVGLESEAYKLVGPQLLAMGHKVVPSNGGPMGGYEALLFTPDSKEPKPDGNKASQQPVNGTYRAGTDHRKDGIAVGW
ncbi:MAG TPA: gamma-glutamyltransferase family protein [Rhizomicrobium sp.]|nr:gamma-glutamyltransferase family protein [Rhizomicrobium sp.]